MTRTFRKNASQQNIETVLLTRAEHARDIQQKDIPVSILLIGTC
jgi:hypothetical protein